MDSSYAETHDLIMNHDFYSLSMFRDLLFHVKEHRFTLSIIKNCLSCNMFYYGKAIFSFLSWIFILIGVKKFKNRRIYFIIRNSSHKKVMEKGRKCMPNTSKSGPKTVQNVNV